MVSTYAIVDNMFMCREFQNQNNIRTQLEQNGLESTNWRNAEIWRSPNHQGDDVELFITLIDDMILVGSEQKLEDTIRTMSGENLSIECNPEFVDMVDRLPYTMSIGWATEKLDIGPDYDGLECVASSYDKDGGTTILKFGNSQYALDAKSELENEMDSYPSEDRPYIEIKCDGVYVTVDIKL